MFEPDVLEDLKNYKYEPPQEEIKILYEDSNILVVNKPSGLLSVPGKQSLDSLTSRIKENYVDANPIHRLDTSTSGIVLFAKNKTSNANLSKQFREKTVNKIYVAWVDGIVYNDFCLLNYPLSKDFEYSALYNAPIQKIDYVFGKKSLTYMEILKREYDANRTLVKLVPHTGRTHQLRIHMASYGYAIIGDRIYASGSARVSTKRLCLHAYYLEFNHPVNNQRISIFCEPNFEIPIPRNILNTPK